MENILKTPILIVVLDDVLNKQVLEKMMENIIISNLSLPL